MGILEIENLVKIFPRKMIRKYILVSGSCFDIMHTNSFEILDKEIEGFCNKGDWLISLRELDLVAVIDPSKEQLVWSWGPGQLEMQHHPSLLENGNILIYDNGTNRGFSRIVELNPLTGRIEWEYRSEPAQEFYSAFRGSSQRLPNGNTLITESDKGRVFEVTREGEIVWEFYNPNTRKGAKERGAIYRMTRITNPEKYGLKIETEKQKRNAN